jgi:hypothetical protein
VQLFQKTKQTPVLDPLQIAEKDIHNGWTAGLISGSSTFLVVMAVLIFKPTGSFAQYYGDPWIFIDVALIFGLAYGIKRRSRVSAVLMLVYFAGSKADQIFHLKNFSGLALALVFILYYARAVRGTFVWHRLNPKSPDEIEAERKEDQEKPWKKFWVGLLWGWVGGVLFGIAGCLSYFFSEDNAVQVLLGFVLFSILGGAIFAGIKLKWKGLLGFIAGSVVGTLIAFVVIVVIITVLKLAFGVPVGDLQGSTTATPTTQNP